MNSTVFVKNDMLEGQNKKKDIEKRLKPAEFEPGPNYTSSSVVHHVDH